MIIVLQDGSEIPVFKQIRNQIVMGISDGRLSPGEKLPTVRALAGEIGINSMTVNKAYQLLKQEGYIIADRRNGVRVKESFSMAPSLTTEAEQELARLISEAKVRGMSRDAFIAVADKYFGETPVRGTGDETEVTAPEKQRQRRNAK